MVSGLLFLVVVAVLLFLGLFAEVESGLLFPCFGGQCFSPLVCRRVGLIDLCVLPRIG
ncbi:hypothetical protein C0J52_13342 [Blattella germanica]|nr:hypothetical protein C0J52_13342 [Blattella germanica]